MIDELQDYEPGWQGGQVVAPPAQEPDPLADYTPDWKKQATQVATLEIDPLADYTPGWNKTGFRDIVIEGLKDQGRGLVQTLKYFISGMGHPGSGLLTPDASGRVPFGKSMLHRDQEAAALGDAGAQKRLQNGATGAALIASTLAAGRVARGLKAGSGLLAGEEASRVVRGLRFVTAEAIGGGVYGYIDPDGQERGKAMVEDAITFPVAGAILHGAFKGVGKAVRSFGWLASKALPEEVTQALKDIKTQAQAEAVAKKTVEIFDNIKPAADEQLTREEIIATQSAAVEAAVKGVDIPKPISVEPSGVPFPKITPVHRKVIRTFFGPSAKVYESAYNVMRAADSGEKYAAQKRLMTALESALTPEQRAQLRVLDNSGWEDAIAKAMDAGDELAAADIAITRAVEEVPIAEVATPEIKAEAAKIKEVIASDAQISRTAKQEEVIAKFLRENPGETRESVLDMISGKGEQARLKALRDAEWAGVEGTPIPGLAETLQLPPQMGPVTPPRLGYSVEAQVEANKRALKEETKAAVRKAITDDDLEGLALKLFADVSRRRDATIAGLRESWKPEFQAMREVEAVHPSDILPVGVDRVAPEVTTNPSVLYARASEAVKKMIEDEGGAIASKFAAQIGGRALLGVGSYASFKQMDEEHSVGVNTSLFALSMFLGTSAILPGKRTAQWFTTHKFFSKYVKWADVRRYATTEGKEGFDLWHSITNTAKAEAVLKANKLRELLSMKPGSLLAKTDPILNRNFAFAVDEGTAAPEFHLLSPELQAEALSLKIINETNGAWVKAQGYIGDPRENYFRNILPRDTFDHWLAQRAKEKALGNTDAVARLETLRGLLDHAQQNGLEGPIENVAEAQAKHMVDVGRIVARNEVRKFFESLNRIVPYDRLTLPNGWRKIEDTTLMAPDDIATIVERIVKPSVDAPFIDYAKGVMMKSIMIFPWEHGINLLRGVGALANPVTSARFYMDALKMIDNADPMIVEKAKYMQLFKQPDRLDETKFASFLKKIGLEKLTTLHHASERLLWERWAPATALATHALEMLKWTKRTKGRFPIGSPEYEAAARRYGHFADDVAGKLPELLQDPKMAAATRALLFSPSWTRTRIGIIIKAAKELQDIVTGELKPNEATYLPYKIRALAFGTAFTWILSKLWGKDDPQFNPNTTKLYARTGLYDDKGRELGVDLVGWWQDDIKLFSDPLMFFEHRLNPMLRSTYQGYTKRDAFGNELTYAENLGNVFRQLGPLSAIPTTVADALSGNMNTNEAVRQGSEILAVGNVSSLPKLTDVALAKYAEKLQRTAGLPVHREDTYVLVKLMKQNNRQSSDGSLYGDNIKSWLVYKQLTYQKQNRILSMWYRGKKLLADTFEE